MPLRKRHTSHENDPNNQSNDGKNKNNNNRMGKDDNEIEEYDSPVHVEKSCFTVESASSASSSSSSSSSNSETCPPSTKVSLLDRLLRGYVKFMSSGINQDRSLKLLQYTLWFFSYVINTYKMKKIGNNNNNKDNRAQHYHESLLTLSYEVLWARYLLRLFGLPAAIEAARSGSWSAASSSSPKLHKFIGKALAWSMIFYYPLEHIAYIQWKTPKLLFYNNNHPSINNTIKNKQLTANNFSAWSCRFWLIYIVLEVIQSMLSLREEQRKNKEISGMTTNADLQNARNSKTAAADSSDICGNQKSDNNDKNGIGVDDDRNNSENEKEEINLSNNDNKKMTNATTTTISLNIKKNAKKNGTAVTTINNNDKTCTLLRLQIIRNLLFTLPCINWSLPNWDTDPLLSEPVVNNLMLTEAVVCIYQTIFSLFKNE